VEAIDLDTIRKRLHEALEDILEEEDTSETVLAGWVMIFEGVHPNDERSLTVVTANATGEEHLSPWQGEGYLHHVANNYYEYYDYNDVDEAEEETDD
jgi:hypothetical protein